MRELSCEHRMHACFFAMPELVQLINQTNSRLIYQQLVKNLAESKINNAGAAQAGNQKNSDSKVTDIQI